MSKISVDQLFDIFLQSSSPKLAEQRLASQYEIEPYEVAPLQFNFVSSFTSVDRDGQKLPEGVARRRFRSMIRSENDSRRRHNLEIIAE